MGRAQLAEPHRHAPLLAVREFEDDSQQPPPSTLQAPINDERTTRRRSALNRSLLYFRLSTAPCATLPPAGYPRPMWRRPLQSQTWLDGLRPDVRANSRPSAPRSRTDARLVERAVPPCLSATWAKRARMVARSPARRESGTNERRHSPRHIGPHRAGGTRCGTMRPPVPTCAPGAKRLPVVPRPERSRPTKPNIGGNDKRKRARYDKEPVWGQRGAPQASKSRSHSSPVITPSDASFFAIALIACHILGASMISRQRSCTSNWYLRSSFPARRALTKFLMRVESPFGADIRWAFEWVVLARCRPPEVAPGCHRPAPSGQICRIHTSAPDWLRQSGRRAAQVAAHAKTHTASRPSRHGRLRGTRLTGGCRVRQWPSFPFRRGLVFQCYARGPGCSPLGS